MPCRPASSNSATKGVVFHTSASTIGTHAPQGSASQADPAPPADSKTSRQTSAATTVGSAHGSSTIARATPRSRPTVSSATASARPATSSRVTLATVKAAVRANASRNRPSASTSR